VEQFDVSFLPFNSSIKVDKGKTLLDAARKADIPIASVCGGKGKCGKCKVKILSKVDFLGVTKREKGLVTEKELTEGMRLACQTKIYGDMIIEVPEESIVRGFVKDKAGTKRQIFPQPVVCLYPIEISIPSFSDNESDVERIKRELKKMHNVSVSRIDPFCFKAGPLILRKEKWKVNVVVSWDEEILHIKPKNDKELYGVAMDIGTTTIGAYLLNLKDACHLASGSTLNPQIKFGEDIMSRIGYIRENGIKGLMDMNKTLIKGLNALIDDMCRKASISKKDIFEVTVVGNTVMHHIFLNINPSSLGLSPFTPFLSSSITLKARDLGIKINPAGNVYVLPVKGGFVGADNIGVVLALKPYLSDEDCLIIDIGTNGEIVAGNKDRLVCASCATGPALEGAHVKHGMRADIGAIEKVTIDPKTKEVEYKVMGDKKPKGICGSGVIDVVSELFKARIIDSSGRFKKDINSKRLRNTYGMMEFVIEWAEHTATGRDITITQEDIRNVQFAKASIYAGAKILLRHLNIDRPSKIMLAGAFGNYIDVKNAYVLGMFPYATVSQITAVGNAAGEGAIFALLNRKEREEAEKIARKIEYVELTLYKGFQEEFLDALYIPHRKDPFPDIDDLLKDYQ